MEPINPQEPVAQDLMKQMEDIKNMPSAAPAQPTAPQPAMTPSMSYAGFWRRLLALFLDGVLMNITYIVILFIFHELLSVRAALAFNSWYVYLQWPIPVLISVYSIAFIGWRGQTLGKQFLGIKVVTVTGGQVSWIQAIVREVFKIVSSYALFLGYLWMLWDKDKQTWHDKVAKTYVIKLK